MQVEKTGTIGGVELQPRGRLARRQLKAQALLRLAHHACCAQLVLFGKAAAGLAQIQLAAEQRLRGQQRLCRGRLHALARRGGARHDDELVGQRVGQRQQVPRHGGGQGVKGRAKFRFGQRALDGFQTVDGPAVFGQKAREGAAGEKAQVRFIQQAFGAVAEFARHQLRNQAAVAGVGNGDEHAPAFGQQAAGAGQHLLRVAGVLQHVGADDGVVLAAGEQGGEVGAVQVGHFHAAVVGSGQGGFFSVEGEAVNHRAIAAPREKAAHGAAAAAQVQHARAGRNVGAQNGKGGALAAVNLAVIHVQGGRGHGHGLAFSKERSGARLKGQAFALA